MCHRSNARHRFDANGVVIGVENAINFAVKSYESMKFVRSHKRAICEMNKITARYSQKENTHARARKWYHVSIDIMSSMFMKLDTIKTFNIIARLNWANMHIEHLEFEFELRLAYFICYPFEMAGAHFLKY